MAMIHRQRRPATRLTASVLLMAVSIIAGLGLAVASADETAPPRGWGFGWDDGLTLRRWLGAWELGLAAGPDDELIQIERSARYATDPPPFQGLVEVPQEERRESGWVRLRVGHLLRREGGLSLVVFSGLTYNWVDDQDKSWVLDPVAGGYDGVEVNRFTHRWAVDLGLRSAWSPLRWLSLEFSFGLRYAWENWDESSVVQHAGVPEVDRENRHGKANSFTDFGWEGLSSLAFIFWL
jgi:hypothetical protein